MSDIEGSSNSYEAQSKNMINICTKYGFDSLIISGSYGGHRRHMTHDRQQTTPRVWLKFLTGELKNLNLISQS